MGLAVRSGVRSRPTISWRFWRRPTISRFFGIKIQMYWRDHPPPHFHAFYGDDEATFAIDDGRLLAGDFSPRARRLIEEWRQQYASELADAWRRASREQDPGVIEPLR